MNILKYIKMAMMAIIVLVILKIVLKGVKKLSEPFESGPKLDDPASAHSNVEKKDIFFNCVKYLTVRQHCLGSSINACKRVMRQQKVKENFSPVIYSS